MKHDYKNKLSSLTTKDIEDLMWFYYGGMEEEILIADYHIDLDDPLLLYQIFPLTKDRYNRICPHCKVPLVSFRENRRNYKQEVFCEKCDYVLKELYNCRCEKCMQAQDEVDQAIRQAFHDVKLGSGIGLYESTGLDDYADTEECYALRKKDELYNWENIPTNRLHECYSSLSFFDAAGMRFHLPAYILAEMKNPYASNANVVYCLTSLVEGENETLKNYSIEKLSLLNKSQRDSVVLFLQLCLTQLEYELEAPLITRALNEYWRK